MTIATVVATPGALGWYSWAEGKAPVCKVPANVRLAVERRHSVSEADTVPLGRIENRKQKETRK
jgi:hypothetical protein